MAAVEAEAGAGEEDAEDEVEAGVVEGSLLPTLLLSVAAVGKSPARMRN